MKRLVLLALASACLTAHAAKPAHPDYSGTYDCKGMDAKEGAYTGTVTLAREAAQSEGRYTAYRFQLNVPGFGAYPGHAAARGSHMAIYFANTDQKEKDYGTGIADFKKSKSGKWQFVKFYYQPEYKGGNRGTETCVQR